MKKLFLGILALGIFQSTYAQSLEKMQWFNEPEKWEIKDNALTMFVNATIGEYLITVSQSMMRPFIMQLMAENSR